MYNKYSNRPFEIDDVKHSNYVRLYNILITREKAAGVQTNDVDFDIEDVYIMAKVVCEWKCVLSGKKFQTLEATKWNPQKKTDVHNMVLMNNVDSKKHQTIKSLDELYTPEQIKAVNDLLLRAQGYLNSKVQTFVS
jgi:hypothetical protein